MRETLAAVCLVGTVVAVLFRAPVVAIAFAVMGAVMLPSVRRK